VYTFYCSVFTLLPLSCNTCPLPLVSCLPTGQDLFHPPVLQFLGEKSERIKQKKHDILACLRYR
jgi:hypothetical protein